MPAVDCFDAQTLKDYLLGKLPDADCDAVAAHLEECLACEATISQLDRASDTLTNGLRQPLPSRGAELPAAEHSLQQALDKVQSFVQLPLASAADESTNGERARMPAAIKSVLRIIYSFLV